mgnify:CR=1 FL=1
MMCEGLFETASACSQVYKNVTNDLAALRVLVTVLQVVKFYTVYSEKEF